MSSYSLLVIKIVLLFFQIIKKLAENLETTLNGMNRITESVATFWTAQSDEFKSLGGKMVANETRLPVPVLNTVLRRKNIETWTSMKQVLQDYSVVMNRIISLYLISPAAEPLPLTNYTVTELNFELNVPSTIDVANIMEN